MDELTSGTQSALLPRHQARRWALGEDHFRVPQEAGLFQRWAATGLEGEGAVDAPVSWVGSDEVEGYVVHMRERGLSDSSIKNHLSVIRTTRLDLPDPNRRLDEVRFHQKAP